MRAPGILNKKTQAAQELLTSLGVDGLEGQARLALKLQKVVAATKDPYLKLSYYQTLASILREITKYQYSQVKTRSEDELVNEEFIRTLIAVVLKHVTEHTAREEIGSVIETYVSGPRLAVVAGSAAS